MRNENPRGLGEGHETGLQVPDDTSITPEIRGEEESKPLKGDPFSQVAELGTTVQAEKSSGPASDDEFEQQKRAFTQRICQAELEPYHNQFVASRDGQIVDHDSDLASLTARFFDQNGDVPVYIARVGEPQRVILRTPRPKRA